MCRFNSLPEQATVSTESREAYNQLYSEKLDANHFEAVRDLLPALRCGSLALGLTA